MVLDERIKQWCGPPRTLSAGGGSDDHAALSPRRPKWNDRVSRRRAGYKIFHESCLDSFFGQVLSFVGPITNSLIGMANPSRRNSYPGAFEPISRS